MIPQWKTDCCALLVLLSFTMFFLFKAVLAGRIKEMFDKH